MLKSIKIYSLFFSLAAIFFGAVQDANAAEGLVKCGRTGQPMCTICDLIIGVKVLIDYALSTAGVVALAVVFVGAVMYVFSGADPGLAGKAKAAIGNALIGIVIIVSGWLIVNYTMIVLGRKENLGIQQMTNGWSNFTCVK